MRTTVLTLLAATLAPLAPLAHASENTWSIYSELDLFAYSEVISIKEFADDFRGDLATGDNAQTQNRFEIGGTWGPWRLAYVDRFDYITEFTQDTAIIHQSNENDLPLINREYDVFLGVERLRARGIKGGYNWQVNDTLSVRGDVTWYFDLRDLQSGFARANGPLDPVTEQLEADVNAFIDTLDIDNRDLSPLRTLLADVDGSVEISYAYDEPKFDEPNYVQPVIFAPQPPPLTGVDFSAPGGDGYSIDLGVTWQATPQLRLDLDVTDAVNEFSWDNAPTTYATLDVGEAVNQLIDEAQLLVNSEVARPDDVIDDQLIVDIRNQDYTQKLSERYSLRGRYDLANAINLFGWEATPAVVGQFYRTELHDFPRLGVGLNDNLEVMYDFGGDALLVNFRTRWVYARLIIDEFDADKANTFGFQVGFNLGF